MFPRRKQQRERAKDVIESSDINFDLFRRTRGLKNSLEINWNGAVFATFDSVSGGDLFRNLEIKFQFSLSTTPTKKEGSSVA